MKDTGGDGTKETAPRQRAADVKATGGSGLAEATPRQEDAEGLRGLEALQLLVERQRRDNEGLRSAMRYRAVIEQAKGILMAKTGTDPETAFRELVEHSQHKNLKLTHVAARVVATTITGAPSSATAGGDIHLLNQATSDDIGLRLAAAAVTSVVDLNELVATVVEHASQYGVVGAWLALCEPDGALRLVAWHGLSASEVSPWQRIPPGDHLPVTQAAQQRQAVWLRDRQERRERFPAADSFPGDGEGSAALPLCIGSQVAGVMGLNFDRAVHLDASTREHLLGVASLCAVPVSQLLSRHDDQLPDIEFEPGHAHWLHGLLDTIRCPVGIFDPVFAEQRLVDLEMRYLNPAAARSLDLVYGASLLEIHPQLANGFIDQVAGVLSTGVPATVEAQGWATGHADATGRVSQLDVTRVGSSLVLSWPADQRDR